MSNPILRRVWLVAAIAGATTGCATSVDVGGFGAAYATPRSTKISNAVTPPAPLSTAPGWPSTYDGGSVGVTGHIGTPSSNGYAKEEITVAHSLGAEPTLLVGDASLASHRTTLYGYTQSFGGVWSAKDWTYAVGFGIGFLWFERELEAADGHGHVFAPTQWVNETAFIPEASACHAAGTASNEWSFRLCGFAAPSVLFVFGEQSFITVGVSAGLRIEADWWPTPTTPPVPP